jgi:hypothetical protein
MPRQPRLEAEAIMSIYCRLTGQLVGYLYHWNNGELLPLWLDEPVIDVRYRPLQQQAA